MIYTFFNSVRYEKSKWPPLKGLDTEFLIYSVFKSMSMRQLKHRRNKACKLETLSKVQNSLLNFHIHIYMTLIMTCYTVILITGV